MIKLSTFILSFLTRVRNRIRAVLSTKLNESGWSDEAHHRSKGEPPIYYSSSFLNTNLIVQKVESAITMEPLLFSTLFSQISPHMQGEGFQFVD